MCCVVADVVRTRTLCRVRRVVVVFVEYRHNSTSTARNAVDIITAQQLYAVMWVSALCVEALIVFLPPPPAGRGIALPPHSVTLRC